MADLTGGTDLLALSLATLNGVRTYLLSAKKNLSIGNDGTNTTR